MPAQEPPKLRIELLGPLRLTVGGVEVELRAPMHRGLLAMLAMAADTVVSSETLIDGLWGDDAPAAARSTLQSYVSVLRKKGRDAGLGERTFIETRQPGYVLCVGDAEVDALVFDRHVRRARQRLAAGTLRDDPSDLRAAVALITGPILPDLDHLEPVRSFVADVHERHKWAVEQLAEIDLAEGRASDAVPGLRVLVQEHPLEERFWGLLMRALYHSGRQADALRAYQDLRELLLDELGVDPSPQLTALERQILDGTVAGDVPLAGDRDRTPTPVPFATTSLIGRSDEVASLISAVRDRRLVTISGPGGCGKTRLASEVARAVSGSFDEVAWVELNTLAAGADVEEAVADGMGIVRRPAAGLVDLIARELAGHTSLLVLDNCEHVIDNAAAVVDKLLASCPELTILATSREHLLLTGEHAIAVPPLESASPLQLARAQFVDPTHAGALFIDRAGPGVVDAAQLSMVEAICAQLDGIPLAIELAAPLAATMSLDDMADRLLDRFRLLADGMRGAPPQHRTLRAVVEWSHDLLEPEEQDGFLALSVFRGPFTMDAASTVVAAVGGDANALLSRLVRKSLVLADIKGSGRTTRYRLLETLRAFGSELLGEHPALVDVRQAFLRHFTEIAVSWEERKQSVAISAWLAELGPDIPNFQAAVTIAREHDVEAAIRLVDAFQWYFNYLGPMAGTRDWLENVASTHELTLEERAMVRTSQAALANFSGDYGNTTALAEEALDASRQLGDRRRLNTALIMRGTTATFEGNVHRAAECLIESAKLSEELGDLGGIAASMVFFGIAHRRSGAFAEAHRCLDRAFDGFSQLGDDRGLALVIGNMGRMAQQEGDLDRSDELTRRALAVALQSLDPMVSAQCGLFCGHVQWERGNGEQALADFEVTLHHSLILGNLTMSSAALEWMVLVGGGRHEEVVVIDAFTQVRRRAPDTASPRLEWDRSVRDAASALTPEMHATLSARGRAMTLDEAIAYARRAANG